MVFVVVFVGVSISVESIESNWVSKSEDSCEVSSRDLNEPGFIL